MAGNPCSPSSGDAPSGNFGHDGGMRIVSLLPSATEIVFLLGLGDDLVGVTHECDWPPPARSKACLTRSLLPKDATPAEIDRLVSASAAGEGTTQRLGVEALVALEPDLVLTQDVCAVCAVPAAHVRAELDAACPGSMVLSLDPSSLDYVLADILRVGAATNQEPVARRAVQALEERLAIVDDAIRRATHDTVTSADQGSGAARGSGRPRVLALEWGDPPYNAGHWVPEMIERAGGEALLATAGAPSTRITWDDVGAADPDVVVFMPCGYNLSLACDQARDLARHPEVARSKRLFGANASAYFSRPGPRLVDGVEALASVLHPSSGLACAPDAISLVCSTDPTRG